MGDSIRIESLQKSASSIMLLHGPILASFCRLRPLWRSWLPQSRMGGARWKITTGMTRTSTMMRLLQNLSRSGFRRQLPAELGPLLRCASARMSWAALGCPY